MKQRHINLMRYKPLIILLVLAVSFQSIAAVSDVHQSHQSGIEHLEFEHDHEGQTNTDTQGDVKSFDCHHCCHCHGGHFSSLLPSALSLVYLELNQAIYISDQSFTNSLKSRLLRPPQA